MENKLEFLKKLNELVEAAKNQGNLLTIEEVQAYFMKESLTEEQTELVYEYLLAQKIAVKGYVKVDSELESQNELSEEEKAYLEEYLKDLKAFEEPSQEAFNLLVKKVIAGDELAKTHLIEAYLQQVVEMAKALKRPEIFLGDLIQEGNLGLVLGVESLTEAASAHEVIVAQIKESMVLLLKEQEELSDRDKKMVEKVQLLDEAITNLTEELGRKVTIDELALYMGLEVEEVEDILKLTGEEPDQDSEQE